MLAVNAQPGSALARAIDPDTGAWTKLDYWLSSIEYTLRWLQWAKTKDGAHNRNKPKPIRPEGEKKKGKAPGGPRMSKAAIKEYLARPRIPLAGQKPVIHSLPAEDPEAQPKN